MNCVPKSSHWLVDIVSTLKFPAKSSVPLLHNKNSVLFPPVGLALPAASSLDEKNYLGIKHQKKKISNMSWFDLRSFWLELISIPSFKGAIHCHKSLYRGARIFVSYHLILDAEPGESRVAASLFCDLKAAEDRADSRPSGHASGQVQSYGWQIGVHISTDPGTLPLQSQNCSYLCHLLSFFN